MTEQSCPWCNSMMEKGHLVRYEHSYFLPDDASPPEWNTKARIEKQGGIPLERAPSSDYPVGYLCRTCRKIVLNY